MSLISTQNVSDNKLLLFEMHSIRYMNIYIINYTMYILFSSLKIVQLYLQHIALSP